MCVTVAADGSTDYLVKRIHSVLNPSVMTLGHTLRINNIKTTKVYLTNVMQQF